MTESITHVRRIRLLKLSDPTGWQYVATPVDGENNQLRNLQVIYGRFMTCSIMRFIYETNQPYQIAAQTNQSIYYDDIPWLTPGVINNYIQS